MRLLIIAITIASFSLSCKTNKAQVNAESQTAETRTKNREDRPNRGERRARPSVEEVFQLDANNDGKLSASEVKDSPLNRNFSRIDTNSDGFITKEEFQNAPKPEKGQRPRRNND